MSGRNSTYRLVQISGTGSELGWSFELEGDEEALAKQVARAPSDRTQKFRDHAEAVRKFRDRLDSFTVLDPACGSGAFLIYSLEYLLRERRRVQRELALVTGGKREELFEFKPDEEIRHILSKNIFGVDINSASVEIARLALWLHTAKSDQPLSNLDTNIVEGNSLVGSELYDFKKDLLAASATKKETINAFDYETRFKAIFDAKRADGAGFDCIVGNPPYVKLQNFKKVYPETADFLRNSTGLGGLPRYKSCQTGNFDLYLPFIERGIELLNPRGRLGYIAPSLWRYNEYGEGLRKFLHSGGHLDRWIDFGSFQVFDEALIYTALQFYSRSSNDRVRFALAPTGELTRIHDWDDPNWFVTYKELPKEDAWILVPRHERAVINKLAKSSKRLDDRTVSRNIFVGIQTSADHIYHLERAGKNRYRYQPPKIDGAKTKPPIEEVLIEDAIMHPLVSGLEANRYQVPETSTYIIFPYLVEAGEVKLFSHTVMGTEYPKAWAFLKRFEKTLREREGRAFDDDSWYRFGRHQNIDKQEDRKLIVAQTVKQLSVCPDEKGTFYLNNVRVNGILPVKDEEFWFLLGILNSQGADWVFRRIAKPKEGGYFEANKQFIAPLPIPEATAAEIAKLTALAKQLTALHTTQRDTLQDINRRFAVCQIDEKPEEWLWPAQVHSLDSLKAAVPKDKSSSERTRWAKAERVKQIDLATESLQSQLRIGARLTAELVKGELRVTDEEVIVLRGVFVDPDESEQILLDWRNYLRGSRVSESFSAAEFAKNLRLIRKAHTKAVAQQIADLDAELSRLEGEIAVAENELNSFVFKLYALTKSEIAIIQKTAL